jgi:hypothetical protein
MRRLPLNLLKSRSLPLITHQQTRLISRTVPFSAKDESNQEIPASKDSKSDTRAQDSGPGWGGREGRDHAVKRPAYDPQAESAKQAMKDHEEGKGGSDAISRKDEFKNNEKAQKEFPESPIVIGMNEERGSVSSMLMRYGA